MDDWCPENDGAYRMEMAEKHRLIEHKKTAMELAAPDLYEALEWIMENREICNIPSHEGHWDEMARSALAKARGE